MMEQSFEKQLQVGRDLAARHQTRSGGGRPRKSDDERMVSVEVNLRPDDMEYLKRLARKRQKPVSRVIREWLEKQIAKERQQAAKQV